MIAAETFLGLTATAWTSVGTIALVLVTGVYVLLTRSTAKSAERAAAAALRSAAAAEQSLYVSSTPLVVFSYLAGKVNDAGHAELDYKLHNTSETAALAVAVAGIRYPVTGSPVQTAFQNAASVVQPNSHFPTEQQQPRSFTIPGQGDDQHQWHFALDNNSYGLVIQYTDFAGRLWRAEMKQASHEFSLTQLDE